MAHITFSEASGLQDSVYGRQQAPIRFFLEKRAEAFERKSIAKVLFDMHSSNRALEMMNSLTAMGDFEAVGENGAYPVNGMQEGPSKLFEHVTWKSSFSLSREIVDDAKDIDLKKRPDQFITAYYRTRERYAAALIGAALQGKASVKFGKSDFSTKGADNQVIFSTNHVGSISKKKQSNAFTDEFSVDALGELETRMQNLRGENDEILDIVPDTIVIPNDHGLKKEVFAAIGADKDPDTEKNGFNYMFGRWNVIVWPYLNNFIKEGTKPWFLFDSNFNSQVGTNVWFDRVKLDVKSSVDENTDANVWRGYARFVAGFNDWRGMMAGGMETGEAL